MTNNDKRLTQELFAEYAKHSVRKKYKGRRRDLYNNEGFAWPSQLLGGWCFIPLRSQFSLDTVIRVQPQNLHNL